MKIMVKKFIMATGLLFLCSVLCSVAQAGTISFDQATTDNSITRSWLNNTFYTVYNTVNGGITSENIASGAVNSDDIATAANPLVRDNELIGEMVFSGLTIAVPSGPASATSTITAGIAYVENDGDSTLHRVVTADTGKTFTVSVDTWVYLDYAGAFSYTEVAVGAVQPTTPTNSIVIAKVTTNGTVIIAVSDQRQTTPTNLRIYTDYKNGLVISRDVTTTTTVTVGKGEIELGASSGGRRINTSSVNVNFTSVGRNGIDAGALAANTYYYIHAIADDANSTNFDVIASLSSTDVTGFTGERLIGWCYANSASAISPDSVGAYKGDGGDAPNYCERMMSDDVTTTSATYVIIPDMSLKFYSSGRPFRMTFNAPIDSSVSGIGESMEMRLDGKVIAATDCYVTTAGYAQSVHIERKVTPSIGTHTLEAFYHGYGGNDIKQSGTTDGPRMLAAEEL